MSKMRDGCVKPARGPLTSQEGAAQGAGVNQEVSEVLVKVGKEAIDFEASAFISGKGFSPVKLSDYMGKWIVICFYPGDFTYV